MRYVRSMARRRREGERRQIGPTLAALKVASAYLFFGSAWVVVASLLASLGSPVPAEPVKAFSVVVLTAFLVFLYVKRTIVRIEAQHEAALTSKLDLVNRLALAAEYRDDLKGGHNYRIGRSSETIALALGLPEDRCRLLGQAAVLHDIGKIGIPDSILAKDGPLTADERRQMEKHVIYGAHLLDGADHDLLHMARTVALTHHEKWDGTGYPYALRGEEIPLEGRIVAVCDVFDALTSDRAYKEAWPIEMAVEYVEHKSGVHFDPEVVQAFMKVVPDLIALRAEEPGASWLAQPLADEALTGPDGLLWRHAAVSYLEDPSQQPGLGLR